jgi:hypothetical protein
MMTKNIKQIMSEPTNVVDEDEEEGGLMFNLFICEDYVEKTWTFGDLDQKLLCSNMSSTDHDLTGQIVWPACVLLSWFIHGNQKLFENRQVVELGAGCGLGGFVAAHYSSRVVITDGNDIVIKLLNQNKDHLSTNNVQISKLLWGVKENVEQLYGSLDSKTMESTHPEVIIGADVILWPNMIISLLYTVRWLLSYKPQDSKCYISYIVRANATTDLLFKTASKIGLLIEDVPIASFLPEDCRFFDGTTKHLLSLSIDEGAVFDPDSEEIREYARQIESNSAPC